MHSFFFNDKLTIGCKEYKLGLILGSESICGRQFVHCVNMVCVCYCLHVLYVHCRRFHFKPCFVPRHVFIVTFFSFCLLQLLNIFVRENLYAFVQFYNSNREFMDSLGEGVFQLDMALEQG